MKVNIWELLVYPVFLMYKVMHVITGLNTGGAETMLLKLLKEWKGKDICHCVVSLIDKGTLGAEIEQLGIVILPKINTQ